MSAMRMMPTNTLALAVHSMRRTRALLIVFVLILALFQVALIVAAASMQQAGTFSSFASSVPPFVREVFGDSLLVLLSFTGIVGFGYFHPIILAALSGFVIAIATEPVAEIETRFIDAILARPLRRVVVVGRSVLLLLLLPSLVIGAMCAGTFAGLRWEAPPEAGVRAGLIGSLALNLWALVECIGGVALAVAAASRRRSTAAGIVGIAMLALFLIDYLARIWKPASSIVWLSPFHYFDAMAMVMGAPLPISHVTLLVAVGAAGAALAFVLFSHRDV